MTFGARTCLLRDRKPHEHSKVTFVELFFDLIFVFAVTQLSHFLLNHFSVAGVLQTALMLMAVWWVWIYTSWATNWLDPQTTPVRIALFVLMLAGLVLSISIPDAFGTRGIGFAAAYVTMQVGRSLFMLWALQRHDGGNYRNFQRITSWFVLSALFWIGGAFADGNTRFVLWAVALAIEYAAPAAGFWTPRLGRSTTAEWDISGSHRRALRPVHHYRARRVDPRHRRDLRQDGLDGRHHRRLRDRLHGQCRDVVDLLQHRRRARGRIYRGLRRSRPACARCLHLHASASGRRHHRTAVSDELILAHPGGHIDFKTAATTLIGPALFLVGNLIFKRLLADSRGLSHMVGMGLLVLAAPAALFVPPLALGALTSAILVVVAIWETRSLGGYAPHEPAAKLVVVPVKSKARSKKRKRD